MSRTSFSKKGTHCKAVVEGKEDAEVCGIRITKGAKWNVVFRVTARGMRTSHKLDRWD